MISPTTFDNRTYYIVPAADVSKIDFSEVLEASPLTLRYSADGTKTFVCYETSTVPASLSAIINKQGPYSNEDILMILESPDWEVITENIPSGPDPFLA